MSRISFDTTKFRSFAKGFIGGADGFFSEAELDSMAWGALIMTLECGSRFLLDYLDGDKYFRVHYPDQNLARAKAHLILAQDMLKKLDEMQNIVRKYCQ